MLFEFDDIIKNQENTTYDLEEAFLKGNSFKNIYSEYKNYKPNNIVITNEQEAYLIKLMMLDFGINDLNLKLVLEPNNKDLYEKFCKYSLLYEKCLAEYEKKYQVLNVCHDTYGKYTLNNKPWPWEGLYV